MVVESLLMDDMESILKAVLISVITLAYVEQGLCLSSSET